MSRTIFDNEHVQEVTETLNINEKPKEIKWFNCIKNKNERLNNVNFAENEAHCIDEIINIVIEQKRPFMYLDYDAIEDCLVTLNNNFYSKKIYERIKRKMKEIEDEYPSYEIKFKKIDKGNHDVYTYRLIKNNEEVCYLRENKRIPNYREQIINYYEKNKKIIF